MKDKTEYGTNSVENKTAKVRRIVDHAIEELAAALESGHSETLKQYLAMLGRFHRYSVGNSLLIWCQKPHATHVAGFQTWKRLGRSVKKGEKGIAILAPIVSKRIESAEEDKEKLLYGFRTAYVFDVTQTDGKDLVEFASVKGDPGAYLSRLRETIERSGIRLQFSENIGPALGLSRGGEILIKEGLQKAEEFSVLVHEFAHELLHHQGECGTRTLRETEAEAVAYVVCHAVGLEPGTASSDYIQLYDGKKETLLESLERIQQTADAILREVKETPFP